MEKDNFNEFIEDDETDVYMAAARYSKELENLTNVINMHYPQISPVSVDDSLVATPFTINDYYADYSYITTNMTVPQNDQIVEDIAGLKITLSNIVNEFNGIKRMLSNTAEKINSLEHRKITL